jgi:hypothetical protein
MPETDFAATILEIEVIVTHITDGYIYPFPILFNGTVSMHGARTEENPKDERNARRYLLGAHNAARTAFGRLERNATSHPAGAG